MTSAADAGADLERRFSGLARLYGTAGYARLRTWRVAVVGLGGVGSWAAEALARSGVAALTLIDLDVVAESNIQRQVQATSTTLGQGKADALATRIATIHPSCTVHVVDDFASPDNWPALLPAPVDAVIDACDQVRTKAALAAWARTPGAGVCHVVCGAAGGKRLPQRLEVADLADATHDALLAATRQRLRQHHGAPRSGKLGVQAVFSRESAALPHTATETAASHATSDSAETDIACVTAPAAAPQGGLNCHGYGSVVTVTASAGLLAASVVIEAAVRG